MTRPSPRFLAAFGVTVAALGVVASAGMAWGTHTMAVPGSLGGGVGQFETTGWAGRLLVGPLWLPNWLVVFAAGIVCWCSWLRALRIGSIPAALPIAFCLYGIAHAGAMVFLFTGGTRARLGPGAPLAVLGFLAMLVLLGAESLRHSPRDGRETGTAGRDARRD